MSHRYRVFYGIVVTLSLAAAWSHSARGEDAGRVATSPTTAPTTTGFKWHPGHYVLVTPRARQTEYLFKHFRGIQKFYNWRTLEPQKDQYDFKEIRADLAFLAAHDARLVIQIQTKSFAPGQNCCPAYLAGPEYGGGFYKTRPGALNPIIWDDRVNQRLLALYRELGRQLDVEPFLEAVVIPETAVTGDVRGVGNVPYTTEGYAACVQAGMQALRESFGHTVVIQYANVPVEIHPQLSAFAVAHGVGLGGPDIFIHDPLLNDPQKGVYRLYAPLSGVIPLGTAVQPEDYERKVFRGPIDPPTAREFFEFGRDKLRLNYMFWSTRAPYFQNVQAMMEEASFPNDPAGGLNAVLPTGLNRAAKPAP